MNVDNWGGAQWVLLTWIALMWVVLPAVCRIAGVTVKGAPLRPAREWRSFYLNQLISAASLMLILWWGGFWA